MLWDVALLLPGVLRLESRPVRPGICLATGSEQRESPGGGGVAPFGAEQQEMLSFLPFALFLTQGLVGLCPPWVSGLSHSYCPSSGLSSASIPITSSSPAGLAPGAVLSPLGAVPSVCRVPCACAMERGSRWSARP